MNRRLILLSTVITVVALALSACGYSYRSQKPCNFVQNVYGERVSWKGNLPITLYMHNSVPSQFYPAFEEAIRAWEDALGRQVFVIGGYDVPGPLNPRQDRTNMIYWMDTWEENKSSEQARTSVYWIGDEIKEADIRINASPMPSGFQFFLAEPRSKDDVHLSSLLIHELGHVLGLRHNDKSGSVMATYLASNVYRDQVGGLDVDSLKCEYE